MNRYIERESSGMSFVSFLQHTPAGTSTLDQEKGKIETHFPFSVHMHVVVAGGGGGVGVAAAAVAVVVAWMAGRRHVCLQCWQCG